MATEDKFTYTCDVSRETNKNGEKVDTRSLSLHMDFTGVSRSQLIAEATRNIVVKLQGRMRASTTRKEKPLTWDAAVKAFNGQTVKVAEVLAENRARKTPQERAAALAKGAANLDDATRKMLIAELTKGLTKK